MERLKKTLKDFVIEHIYQKLMRNELTGGDRLNENSIANELAISRAPVREALKELAALGIVEYKPRKGCFVKTFSKDDILGVYETRGLLEGYAARCIADILTDKDFELLEKMVNEMESMALEKKEIEVVELGDRFHDFLLSFSNEYIKRYARQLSLKSHLMFRRFWVKLYTPEEIKHRHLIIVETIKKKQQIEQIIREHYLETANKILGYL
ncbi:GntR family transcriptional regulator [Hippea jasoniae]|uniref:GntR family transcriptional regulator n=1 Tax=Hippea jasoniae TaxID=944479 RepID=UPI000690C0F1|nr:GntR family transcriptional regulator [Hippea jasoniae]